MATDDKPETIADKFTGLTGYWRYFTTLGVLGLFAGLTIWVVVFELPAERQTSRDEIAKERAISREETKESRGHGNAAAKELGEAIKHQTSVLSNHQENVRENQLKLIEQQAKLLKLLAKE